MKDRTPPLDSTLLQTLAENIKPQPLAADRKQAMRERLLQRIQTEAPPGTQTIRADSMHWQPLNDHVDVKLLHRDVERNEQMTLLRCQPGAVLPSHLHHQDELCVVLEGDIKIGAHRICKGDVHIALAGHQHDEIISESGALLLLRSEISQQAAAY